MIDFFYREKNVDDWSDYCQNLERQTYLKKSIVFHISFSSKE